MSLIFPSMKYGWYENAYHEEEITVESLGMRLRRPSGYEALVKKSRHVWLYID